MGLLRPFQQCVPGEVRETVGVLEPGQEPEGAALVQAAEAVVSEQEGGRTHWVRTYTS